jgi:hypothetical protein
MAMSLPENWRKRLLIRVSSWAKITATFSQAIFFNDVNNFLIVSHLHH